MKKGAHAEAAPRWKMTMACPPGYPPRWLSSVRS